MKWYRVFFCAHTVSDPMVCDTSNFDQYDYFGEGELLVHHRFFRGQPFDRWPSDAAVAVNNTGNDGQPDDVLQNGDMVPIFSGRLAADLQAAGIRGLQFLPIAVRHADGTSAGVFFAANCITAVDAFDYERSVYSRFPDDFDNPEARGKIVTLKYVLRGEALRADVLQGQEVFCLQGQPCDLFVSERFVRLFRRKKYTGCTFSKVDVT